MERNILASATGVPFLDRFVIQTFFLFFEGRWMADRSSSGKNMATSVQGSSICPRFPLNLAWRYKSWKLNCYSHTCWKYRIPGSEFCNIERMAHLFQRQPLFHSKGFFGSFYIQRRRCNVIRLTYTYTEYVFAALDKRISHNVKSQENRAYAQLAAAGNAQREIVLHGKWSVKRATFFACNNLLHISAYCGGVNKNRTRFPPLTYKFRINNFPIAFGAVQCLGSR